MGAQRMASNDHSRSATQTAADLARFAKAAYNIIKAALAAGLKGAAAAAARETLPLLVKVALGILIAILLIPKVDIFEDFINLLGGLNRNDTPLMVNSFYIIDDEKQRAKMTEEFYAAVKKEIATYQERADYLIKSGSQSPAVMDRWVLKIQGLEEKKRHYEQVLRRELDGLDDEFSTLKFLSQELQMRSRSIRFQKAA